MSNYEYFKTFSLDQMAALLTIIHDFDHCRDKSDYNDFVELLQDDCDPRFWKSYCKYYGIPDFIFD